MYTYMSTLGPIIHMVITSLMDIVAMPSINFLTSCSCGLCFAFMGGYIGAS